MFRFMPSTIFLTRESTLDSLRAAIKAAKEVFLVSIEMFA
jgi:hypothetical protein